MTAKKDQVEPATQGMGVTMSPEQFQEMMRTVIQEAKKPYGEDELKARLANYREQMRKDVKEYNEEVKARQERCGHVRIEDGKATIAWLIYRSDKLPNGGVKFGNCMRCQRDFYPTDTDYYKWLSVPSSTVELV